MSSLAIIQARMASQRLPGKVMVPLQGKPVLWHIVQRVRQVRDVSKVIVATSIEASDLVIRDFCNQSNIPLFTGSETDVLDRFYQAASHFHGNPVVRITGDCPLADPGVIQELMEIYASGQYDYVAVSTGAGVWDQTTNKYPDGLDAECFSFASLEKAWGQAHHPAEREHVTPYIWRSPTLFRLGRLSPKKNYAHLRWTLDTPADMELISEIYKSLYRPNQIFSMQEVIHYLEGHPEMAKINQAMIGQENYQKLWLP